jgi:RimJ/RimL family protein N-acetyltransferase
MSDVFQPDWKTGEPLPEWRSAGSLAIGHKQGQWCTLAAASVEQHASDLFDAFQRGREAHDWLYLGYGPFSELSELQDWMKVTCLGPDPLFFVIVDNRTGRACGVASYLNIVPAMGTVEVGHIHFSPAIQRSPVATDAMYLMMQHAFDCGYRRYEWKCDSHNQRSRRAAQRFGFSYEGIFRQHFIVKGRNRDTAWYACIDSEWPELSSAFESWLDPANFDSDGTQKQSLGSLTGPVLKARG